MSPGLTVYNTSVGLGVMDAVGVAVFVEVPDRVGGRVSVGVKVVVAV